MRRLLSLGRDTAGAAAIEMALGAPILAALLLGMSELADGYSAKLGLEQAAQTAIEKVMQGQATATDTSAAALKAEAATLADVPAAQVAVTFYLECVTESTGAAVVTTYTTGCSSTQVARRYMKVVITKTHPSIFQQKFAGTDANGNYVLTGQTSVRVQ